MKVALLTTTNSHLAGGLYNSVSNLGLGLKRNGAELFLMSYNDQYSEKDRAVYKDLRMACYTRPSYPLLKTLGYSPDIHQILENEAPDIVHSQGIWMYNSYAAARYKSRHKDAVTIITPHGMLDPWAVKNSAWKKKVAGWLFEYKNLKTADCIHALCKSEYESIRLFGLKNPVAIIPNGINLPVNPVFTRENEKKILLYIGRIHPKKGLKEMLLGLAKIKVTEPKFFDMWTVRVAGWDQNGHINELQRLVQENGLNSDVEFIGSVYGAAKEKELCKANAFILPSFSEGLPMSVLEAWAYRLPVVMTDFCNLPDGFETGSAYRIKPSPDSIEECLIAFSHLNDSQLVEMGENGYRLVATRYTWDHVAEQTIELYDYLLGKTAKPEFVFED